MEFVKNWLLIWMACAPFVFFGFGNMFTSIRVKRPKLNKFNLNHRVDTSAKAGYLYPVLCEEIVPGDIWRGRAGAMARVTPMLAPVYGDMNIWFHHFFVPCRLLDTDWENFITGGRLGTTVSALPRFVLNSSNEALWNFTGSLAQHLGVPLSLDDATGLPVSPAESLTVNAMPFRAYQLIWDTLFRDQNLAPSLEIDMAPGNIADPTSLLVLRQRAWEKDYFTSALPFAQRGAQVTMPVTATIDEDQINYKSVSDVYDQSGNAPADNTLVGNGQAPGAGSQLFVGKSGTGVNGETGRIENIESIELDGISTTINDFRVANRLQEWLEAMARGGARLKETIWNMFGVESDDARLQRPEYLGGSRQPITISEIVSTFQGDAEDALPQGNMAGHGISVGGNNGYKRRFKEHGYIMTLMSITPRSKYGQGVRKHLLRTDRFDFYWKQFAHLGEQPIEFRELYMDWAGTGTFDNTDPFGYTPRYSEYKYIPSSVRGDFVASLDFWSIWRKFGEQPVLDEAFVTMNPDEIERIFAVNGGDPPPDHFYVSVFHQIDALRPMPYYGTPLL